MAQGKDAMWRRGRLPGRKGVEKSGMQRKDLMTALKLTVRQRQSSRWRSYDDSLKRQKQKPEMQGKSRQPCKETMSKSNLGILPFLNLELQWIGQVLYPQIPATCRLQVILTTSPLRATLLRAATRMKLLTRGPLRGVIQSTVLYREGSIHGQSAICSGAPAGASSDMDANTRMIFLSGSMTQRPQEEVDEKGPREVLEELACIKE